jgi:hypothetical protein
LLEDASCSRKGYIRANFPLAQRVMMTFEPACCALYGISGEIETVVPRGQVRCMAWSSTNLVAISVSIQTEGKYLRIAEGKKLLSHI